MARYPLILLFLTAVFFVACGKKGNSDKARPVRLPLTPVSSDLAEHFDGQKAYKHVEALTNNGPRPPESPGYEQALIYLEESLKEFDWITHRQNFKAATPEGPVSFTNLLARHGSAPALPESLPILIGGHLDTKKLSFHFAGANDSGSSTGVMLELARVLSQEPQDAAKVELLFFDGEEAFRPDISRTDGLYGSKYFAHSLSTRPTWPALGIVLDIVGDADYPLLISGDVPEPLAESTLRVAGQMNPAPNLKHFKQPIIDDHIPLIATGLPCLHLIGDFMTMDYWHQPSDTLDKIDAEMLDQVGELTLLLLADDNPGIN